MFFISDETIDKFIKEDVPYFDLTSLVFGIEGQRGRLRFYTRDKAIVCGTEEVEKLYKKLGVDVINYYPSGSRVNPNDTIFEAEGPADSLHTGWKVSQNILEYYSGIATRTRKMVDLVKEVNSKISVVTTRKTFPGTKELIIKAVISGGGVPHRLGLSETILVFKQHRNFIGNSADFINMLQQVKAKVCEKKIIVEAESIDEAIMFVKAGVDGIQFDKLSPEELRGYVERIKNINPRIVLLAAGGINEKNAADYARSGVDALVTTSVYFGKPVDIGTEMDKI